jgi:long-chain acyl-CoA synthetase
VNVASPGPHGSALSGAGTATAVDLVRRRAQADASAPALVHGSRSRSFGDLVFHLDAVGRALIADGVKPHSRVAILGRNSIEFFEILLGAASIGAVTVPLNWRLASREIEAIIADAEPDLVFVDAEFVPLLGRRVRAVVVGGGSDDLPAYQQWCASGAPDADLRGDWRNDTVLQLYTSGTTGQPKGVMSTNTALSKSLALLAQVTGMVQGAVSLCTLPAFHIGGTSWTLAGLTSGSLTVLLTDVDPVAILDAIERHRVSVMIAVPTIVQRLAEHPQVRDRDLTSLKTVYYGGGPMTSSVIERALATLDCDFIQGFGLTELPLVSVLPSTAHLGHQKLLRSCGQAAEETEIRLVNPDTGAEVPVGLVGEIQVRSPRLMSGYWRKPELTAAAVDSNGWFHTGDAASRDEEGFLYIQDRIKDMIVTGGENVYPAEVENVLMGHPAVSEVAVLGTPSKKWTEAVVAIVVPREGHDVSEESLIDYCRERLARYKCPQNVIFVDGLPRTPAGKLQKYVLRDELRRTVDPG